MTDTITIKKDSLKNFAIIALVILLLAALFTGGFSSNNRNGGSNGNAVIDNGNNLPSVDMEVLVDDDSIKGEADAPVTIVEFSDYECPFCARFYTGAYEQIKTEYIDTGKVKFVYRDFPLNFHPNAQKAAEAAECAGEQGMYYEMHDLLFELGVSGGVDSYKEYAQDIDLNTAEFNECLDSGEMADEVKEDMVDGQNAGVQGTPAFFVNGEMISGAQPFSVFKAAIDANL